MRGTMRIFVIFTAWCFCTGLAPAQDKAAGQPVSAPKVEVLKAYAAMELLEKKYTFGEILEGEQISHVFVLKNKGTGPLEIKKVQLGCKCLKSEQDTSVPPGGEGKITVRLDSSGQGGSFLRFVTVYTNDPIQPYVRLAIEGKVKPLIEVIPGNLITLSGVVDKVQEQTVDLKASSTPFHITGSETELQGKISYEIATIEDGKHYRVTVKNAAGEGSYRGGIRLKTDLPMKNKIALQVKGEIKGLITVLPRTVRIGNMGVEGDARTAKIQLRKNGEQAFNIIKMAYDENLMTVVKEAIPDGSGYELTVTPQMATTLPITLPKEGKPERLETTLSIFTDLNPEPYVIKVVLMGSN